MSKPERCSCEESLYLRGIIKDLLEACKSVLLALNDGEALSKQETVEDMEVILSKAVQKAEKS